MYSFVESILPFYQSTILASVMTCNRIDLEEFVSGCMQLHGPAKSLQLAKMSFENKILGPETFKPYHSFAVEVRSNVVEEMSWVFDYLYLR